MAGRRVMSEDLKNVEFETSEDVDVTPTFDNMGLREELLRGIYAYGKNLLKNVSSHIVITSTTLSTINTRDQSLCFDDLIHDW